MNKGVIVRRWLFWLLILAFLALVIVRFAEIKTLLSTLAKGRGYWVLVAAILQFAGYVVFAMVYHSAFETVGVRSRTGDLLPVVFASVFVNTAAPVGVSGIALFADDAVQRGESGARAAAGNLLVFAAEYSSFTVMVALGLLFMVEQNDLVALGATGAAVLMLVIGVFTSILLLGLWRPDRLRRLLEGVQRAANRTAARFKRPQLLAEGWAEKNAAELAASSRTMAAQPKGVARTLALALTMHLVRLGSLYAVFLAFYQPVPLRVIIPGFAMGVLYWMVAITPQGIGLVEGVMTVVFISLGVPPSEATVITLAFRGLSFWLPLVIGFVLLRRVRSFGSGVHSRE